MFKIPNNSNLTDEELYIFHKVDSTKHISPSDRRILQGLHFCPDWNGLTICNKLLEWEACTCKKQLVDRLYTDLLIGQRFKPTTKETKWWVKETYALSFKRDESKVTFYPHTLVLVEEICNELL